MSKNNKQSDSNANWYEVWMQQTKTFFDSAEGNLAELFTSKAQANPDAYLAQMHAWLETLKKHWQFTALNEQQQATEKYWQAMSMMCCEASELMAKQWLQRAKENKPVKNIKELYELWLNACHEVYAKAMHSSAYQTIYGDLMNASIHYWQSVLPK